MLEIFAVIFCIWLLIAAPGLAIGLVILAVATFFLGPLGFILGVIATILLVK